jgi:hypothetical protein
MMQRCEPSGFGALWSREASFFVNEDALKHIEPSIERDKSFSEGF